MSEARSPISNGRLSRSDVYSSQSSSMCVQTLVQKFGLRVEATRYLKRRQRWGAVKKSLVSMTAGPAERETRQFAIGTLFLVYPYWPWNSISLDNPRPNPRGALRQKRDTAVFKRHWEIRAPIWEEQVRGPNLRVQVARLVPRRCNPSTGDIIWSRGSDRLPASRANCLAIKTGQWLFRSFQGEAYSEPVSCLDVIPADDGMPPQLGLGLWTDRRMRAFPFRLSAPRSS